MKIIIAGSRTVRDMHDINEAVRLSRFNVTEVVCGMARGADLLGMTWATYLRIPVSEFPADWDAHGKSAGYKRNRQMGEYADGAVIVWDGISRGSQHMADIMKQLKKPFYVHKVLDTPARI
jgi:hypothetical protein